MTNVEVHDESRCCECGSPDHFCQDCPTFTDQSPLFPATGAIGPRPPADEPTDA